MALFAAKMKNATCVVSAHGVEGRWWGGVGRRKILYSIRLPQGIFYNVDLRKHAKLAENGADGRQFRTNVCAKSDRAF